MVVTTHVFQIYKLYTNTSCFEFKIHIDVKLLMPRWNQTKRLIQHLQWLICCYHIIACEPSLYTTVKRLSKAFPLSVESIWTGLLSAVWEEIR